MSNHTRFNLQVVDISDPSRIQDLMDPPSDQLLEATKNSPCKFQVGDKVRLNDVGLEQCFGHSQGLSYMKQKVYTLTHVDAVSITAPEASYPVEVDDPELNKLLLDDYCFDLIKPLHQGRAQVWLGNKLVYDGGAVTKPRHPAEPEFDIFED